MPEPEQPEWIPSAQDARAWQLAASLWMGAVLVAFLIIRILQSQSAHWVASVMQWWKAL